MSRCLVTDKQVTRYVVACPSCDFVQELAGSRTARDLARAHDREHEPQPPAQLGHLLEFVPPYTGSASRYGSWRCALCGQGFPPGTIWTTAPGPCSARLPGLLS